MNTRSTQQNQDLETRNQSEASIERPAKTAWRKPVIKEANCALEINCYVTASGTQERR